MSQSVALDRPRSEVLSEALRSSRPVPRNGDCPCASGRKFKACCHPSRFTAQAHELGAAVLGAVTERMPGWNVIAAPNHRTREVAFTFRTWDGRRKIGAVACIEPGATVDRAAFTEELIGRLAGALTPNHDDPRPPDGPAGPLP